ncbi:MAG: glucosaminidase domain-containing protein [Bryobacteraceae bacterium]
MRKLISNGLVMFAGIVSLPSPVTHRTVEKVPVVEFTADERLEALQEFFAASACPAVEVAHVFIQAADAYGLDWRLLPSISFVESTGGKTARNNNLFGWDSGKARYPSLSAAVHGVAYFLANSRLYKDKTLDEKLATYNPDAGYARKVKRVMRKIAPTE